ncbi:MAG TPA: PQQ-binding-like beta-propeller repeat protein [Pseudonocardiaceae bacterium]|nr:PQQ-binding-like beta-propeller repeat protein [Pseudonocardiaceae bacterium]
MAGSRGIREITMVPLVLAALAGATLAGCDGAGNASAAPTSTVPPLTASGPAVSTPLAAGDWPTYHGDNARTGFAGGLAPIGVPHQDWHSTVDGAVYGQPLVVGSTVLAATENDTVYALDAATGRVNWSTHVGTPVPQADLPCGDIDPLGITGTMAYDPTTSRVFAVAESTGGAHTLVGLDVRTGAVVVRVELEPPRGDRLAHQQRAALTVLAGRVYVAYGGLYGDCANYIGSVVSVTTAGVDPISYAVPTSREGGIWAPGGATVLSTPAGDTLLYSVGNGAAVTSGTGYDGSDAVQGLTPALRTAGYFAPSSWADDNAGDLDLGSSGPTVLGPWVFIAGKRGDGYVLRAGSLGGIGGQVSQLPACRSFGGSAVADNTIYLPCPDGPRALTIDAAGTASVRWHAAVSAAGSPTVGGGAVWVVDYSAGVLYALDPATGAVRAQVSLGPTPHFASPTLSGSHAYVGTMTGVTSIAGA